MALLFAESVISSDLKKVSCTPVGSDLTGPLSTDYAVLFGSLAPVSLLYPGPDLSAPHLLKCSMKRKFHVILVLRAVDVSTDAHERVGFVCNAKLGIDSDEYIFGGRSVLTTV